MLCSTGSIDKLDYEIGLDDEDAMVVLASVVLGSAPLVPGAFRWHGAKKWRIANLYFYRD